MDKFDFSFNSELSGNDDNVNVDIDFLPISWMSLMMVFVIIACNVCICMSCTILYKNNVKTKGMDIVSDNDNEDGYDQDIEQSFVSHDYIPDNRRSAIGANAASASILGYRV